MLRSFLFLCMSALLVACSSDKPAPFADLTFTRYQPISLNVSRIDIVEEYKSPMRAPNVEHLMPYSPADAMHIWVKDRLRAVGLDKSLQVIIKDGSVVAVDLPKPGGIGGFFTLSQTKRYDAKIDVEMRIYNGEDAMSEANIEVSANRSVTIREDSSPAEREAIYRKLIFDLMESLNAELEKNIFTYFGNAISYAR